MTGEWIVLYYVLYCTTVYRVYSCMILYNVNFLVLIIVLGVYKMLTLGEVYIQEPSYFCNSSVRLKLGHNFKSLEKLIGRRALWCLDTYTLKNICIYENYLGVLICLYRIVQLSCSFNFTQSQDTFWDSLNGLHWDAHWALVGV